MLEIKKLNKHFGGIKAVNNCSFKINVGEITALIGPNGSGKTTIFNLISGILKANSGKIILDKTDITNNSPESISNTGISRLFQKSQLFDNLTIKENLLLALDNEDTNILKNLFGINQVTKKKEKKIRNILELVEMEKFENKRAKELSYGQKRLVEITRAILNPHKLLMLDEPVAGVNQKIRTKISNILTDLKNNGATIILIEHDMNFALNLADQVIVMDEGKVIAKGNSVEIKNNPKVLEAYFGN